MRAGYGQASQVPRRNVSAHAPAGPCKGVPATAVSRKGYVAAELNAGGGLDLILSQIGDSRAAVLSNMSHPWLQLQGPQIEKRDRLLLHEAGNQSPTGN